MNWKDCAKAARLSNGFIANALGYSNPTKVSQAFGWETVPAAICLLIVVAEQASPTELNKLLCELSIEERREQTPGEIEIASWNDPGDIKSYEAQKTR